jgi:hypothetical protein
MVGCDERLAAGATATLNLNRTGSLGGWIT